MAITQGMSISFKQELLRGIHDFDADEFRLALYKADALISPSTQTYTTEGEVTGPGYATGGNIALVSSGYPKILANSGVARFDDVSWLNATIQADGGLIYNASKGNRAVIALEFGRSIQAHNDILTIRFPTASNPIIRLV